MRLEAEATRVVPGRPSPVVLRLTNDRPVPVAFRVRTVGLADDWVDPPTTTPPVAPGATVEVPLTVHLPSGFPASRQLAGVVAEPVGGGAPLRADLVLEVGGRLGLQADLRPRDIRGGDDGRFAISLVNDADEPATVELEGVAPDGHLKVAVPRGPVRVGPGERLQLRGRVKGRRPLAGQPRRLPFGVRAVGSAPPVHLEGSFTQTPIFSSGVLRMLSVVTVVALWLGALGIGLGKLNADDDDLAADRVGEVDGEGDGGSGGAGGDDEGDDGDPGAEGEGATAASGAKLGGTVDAPEPGGVVVRVEPVKLTDEDVVGASLPSGVPRAAGKRAAVDVHLEGERRQTVTDETGQYAIAGLRAPAFYLVTFSKAGYSTRSFVVEATEDGEPIALDVMLEAGPGRVSGVVVDTDGRPLGGAAVTVTDGTVTLQTTTATTGDGIGQFEVAGLTTPGSFLVSAARSGFGTESTLVQLDGSGSASGLVLRLQAGVGSLSGRVHGGGSPLGGVNVTVSGEGIARTTTTLTDDPVGAYAIPQLPIPGEYTVEVVGEGFATSTQRLTIDGNAELDIELHPTLGRVQGRTLDQIGTPLAGVGVTLRSETETFKTTSVDDPLGTYELESIPAGTYVVTYERFGYTSATQTVVVGPGETAQADATLVELEDHGVIANAAIVGTVTSPAGAVTGEVRIDRPDIAPAPIGPDGTFSFGSLAAGVYNLRVVADRHEVAVARTIVAQASTATIEVELTPWASARGVVRSGTPQGPTIAGAEVVFTNSKTQAEVTATTGADGTFTLEQALPAGSYSVAVEAADHIDFSIPNLTVDPGGHVELTPVLSFKQILEVEVLRDAGGQPFTGARVVVEDLFTGEILEGTVTIPTDGSNQKGIVRFRGLEQGHYYWVTASAANHLSQFWLFVAQNNHVQPITFRLVAGAGVNGRIEWDDDGTSVPIDGATIEISGTFQFDENGEPVSSVRTVTAPAEGFTLFDADLPIQGNASVTITHPDFEPFEVESIDLRSVGATPEVFNPVVLQPLPGSATGTLDFAPGAPDDIDDLQITVVDKPSRAGDVTVAPELLASGEVRLVLRDAAVSETEDLLVPGNYRLRFTYPDHVEVTRSFRVEPNDDTSFEAELQRRGTITARVRARANGVNPPYNLGVGGAAVVLTHPDGTTTEVTAGANGNATFSDLAPGTYWLRATAPSHQPDPNEPVEVTLAPGGNPSPMVPMVAYGRMVGNVVVQDGNVTTSLDIPVLVTASINLQGGTVRSWTATDPAGSGGYTLVGSADASNVGLLNGTLQMSVRQDQQTSDVPGYDLLTTEATVDTTSGSLLGRCGGATDRCDLVLRPQPGAIRGRVTTAGAAPVGVNGVTVTATRSDGTVIRVETTVNCPPTVFDGGPGCYGYESGGANTFAGLPHGTYALKFEATGYKPLEVSPITVQRGQTNTVETVQLATSTTTLEVDVLAVYDPQQDPLPLTSGVQVGLYQNNALVGSAKAVDDEGRVTFTNLPDGQTYQIRAVGIGYALSGSQQWPTVTTAGGTELRTVFVTAKTRQVRVTVRSSVRGANNQPLPIVGAEVTFRPRADSPNRPEVSELVTNDNGRVTTSLPPGSYDILVDGDTASPAHLDGSGQVTVPVVDQANPPRIEAAVNVAESLVRGTVTVDDGEGGPTTADVRLELDTAGSANDRVVLLPLGTGGVATFELYVFPATYTIRAGVEESQDHTTDSRTGVILSPAGTVVGDVALTLQRLGSLRVRVEDADGAAVPGASVSVNTTPTARTGTTGTQGTVTFDRLRPALYTISASLGGQSGSNTFEVQPGHVPPADGLHDVVVVISLPETTTSSTTQTTTPSTTGSTLPDG